MKKKTIYKDAPKNIANAIKSAKEIEDFLPSPDQLVFKDETVKVTISLSKKSVDFFKDKAHESGVPYQKMIKSLLDSYTTHYNH